MSFKQKYSIKADYIEKGTNRRSGDLMPAVEFGVQHDTGNDGSTAQGNVNYYKNSSHVSGSAHTFIDDKDIIECIPLLTGKPEKAWHVRYNVTGDNAIFGDDANDIAAGVELCYSHARGSINNLEAYKRYVWYWALVCYTFKMDPRKDLIGHNKLDPSRRTDPVNALSKMGLTVERLIEDIVAEIKECTAVPAPARPSKPVSSKTHTVVKGDSMWKIAKSNGLGMDELISLNPHIKDPGMLQIGDVINLVKAVKEAPKPAPVKPAPVKKPTPVKPKSNYELPHVTLKLGSKGPNVKALQVALNKLYFKCGTPDGNFGAKTKDAIQRFQKVHLPYDVDGIYGSKTRAKMLDLLN